MRLRPNRVYPPKQGLRLKPVPTKELFVEANRVYPPKQGLRQYAAAQWAYVGILTEYIHQNKD